MICRFKCSIYRVGTKLSHRCPTHDGSNPHRSELLARCCNVWCHQLAANSYEHVGPPQCLCVSLRRGEQRNRKSQFSRRVELDVHLGGKHDCTKFGIHDAAAVCESRAPKPCKQTNILTRQQGTRKLVYQNQLAMDPTSDKP